MDGVLCAHVSTSGHLSPHVVAGVLNWWLKAAYGSDGRFVGWKMQRQPFLGSATIWLQAFGTSPTPSAALRQCGIAVLLLEAGMGGHVHTWWRGWHDLCRLDAGCIHAVVLVRGTSANPLSPCERNICLDPVRFVLDSLLTVACRDRAPSCMHHDACSECRTASFF